MASKKQNHRIESRRLRRVLKRAEITHIGMSAVTRRSLTKQSYQERIHE